MYPSIDNHPWDHPFLTPAHIKRFRDCSDKVWSYAASYSQRFPRTLDCAFAVNMAQNMYKWAALAQEYGANATLYLNPQDASAISRPEWEEFDGEHEDLLNGRSFVENNPGIKLRVPCLQGPNEGSELWAAYHPKRINRIKLLLARIIGRRSPSLNRIILSNWTAVAALRLRSPSVRHSPLIHFQGAYPYFRWAEMLAKHDVTYIASTPFPAYASGQPYCICSVGGDLQFDCGRLGDHGRAMRAAFEGAHSIFVSNPVTLAHCRRFGLTNAVYLPYPMDTNRYSPGECTSREDWKRRFGGDVFVLTTSRIDKGVKGHSDAYFEMLMRLAGLRPEVRFIFLGWGTDAEEFRRRVTSVGLEKRVIMLSPVGKKRLIDYYRSCDIVLDQFVYGYFGATALEAAAVGKPVVMKLREEQYRPLYNEDLPPVFNASTPDEIQEHLLKLIDSYKLRVEVGKRTREWLVRNHGEQKTVPLMLALLRLAAENIRLPPDLDNPLRDALSPLELDYHQMCREEALRQ